MPKGEAHKKYTGKFKQMVVEMMRLEHMSCRETDRHFDVPNDSARLWERIYLEERPEGLYIERRGRGSKGRPVKLDKHVEEDLIAENQRLRAENVY